MAESTLSLTLNDLSAEVGLFLGWGRGATLPYTDPAWTTQQQAAITSAVNSGLRQFYFPPPLHDGEAPYDWSFLKPVATLSLPASSVTVPLPDDFGGFEGRIVITTQPSSSWWPVDLTGVGRVYEQQAKLPSTTGRPQMACEEPLKGTTGTQGQRFQLRFWPIPDQAYTLQFQYYLLPDALSPPFPYIYGGASHAETILASCKWAAERDLDDMAGGPQAQNFMMRLAASIGVDRKFKPQNFGYARDNSDWRHGNIYDPWREWARITIQGVQYALLLGMMGLAVAFGA